MPTLHCNLSQSLMAALQRRAETTGESLDHIVMGALADTLQVDHATLFQVSTSGALVEGVYQGAVTVDKLLAHGDMGIGTFEGLDGEMIVVDGECYSVRPDGHARPASPTELVPFALVCHFEPERSLALAGCQSMAGLQQQLDTLRDTRNTFFAVRLDGTFESMKVRTVLKAEGHETLVETAAKQALFEYRDIPGTLLGFWTPGYAGAIGIPGYHLHFIADDRSVGGHVLDCSAGELSAAIEHVADFRLAIPETAEFLRADLSGNPTAAIDKAER